VIADFLKKLKQNPNSLEVLGDGTQSKSYIHISDCISAIAVIVSHFLKSEVRVEAYNLSSADRVTVKRIAEIALEETGAKAQIRTTGGIDGGRGWRGDVKFMQLSNQKLQSLGWKEHYNSEAAVRQATRELTTQV
jgi:UDP-glucose 4-epimerase